MRKADMRPFDQHHPSDHHYTG